MTDFGSILEHGNKPNNQSITTDFSNVNSTATPSHFENFYDILPIVFVLAVMILPQVIITMIGLMRATGSMKRCITFLSGHPQVIFLAIFTHFVISSRRLGCKKCTTKRKLMVSKKLTILSIVMHVISVFVSHVIYHIAMGSVPFCLPFIIPGIIFTLSFLCLGNKCC